MVDKDLRSLERFQDSVRLKLLQRRLGQSVYIQEYPRPIQVFNSTELLIDISKDEYGYGYGYGGRSGDGYGDGGGGGRGDDDGFGDGHGYGDGGGFEYGDGRGDGDGVEYEYGWEDGSGYGLGYGSELGNSEYSYTENLRRNTQWIKI